MANPAEKFPLPGVTPHEEAEDITDQLDELIVEEGPDLKIVEDKDANDETAEALRELDQIHASREADKDIKAKIAEKHAAGQEAMKKKMAADKNKANMADLRAKLAAPKSTAPKPVPAPPGFEKPAGMSDEFLHDLSRAKDFVGSGLLPKGFAEQYEQAYFGVKNTADAVETAGFFKKFGLKRKLKKAMKQLDAMQNEMATHKLDAQKDKNATAKAAELAAMSPEERAAYDKKQKVDAKRWMHRQGMKQ